MKCKEDENARILYPQKTNVWKNGIEIGSSKVAYWLIYQFNESLSKEQNVKLPKKNKIGTHSNHA